MALPTDFGSPASPGYALPSEQTVLNRLGTGEPLSEPEKQQFRAYKLAQDNAGAPLFPTVAARRHKQATAAETMVLDGWDAIKAKGIGDPAKFDLVPEDQRPLTARALWLSNQFNQPFKQVFDQLPAYELKYSQQFGPVQDPGAEVDKQMKLSLQRQRDQRALLFGTPGKKGTPGGISMSGASMPYYDPNAYKSGTPDTPAVKGLLQEAHEAALEGKPVADVLKSLAGMKDKPGFDTQSAGEWAGMAQKVYAQTWQANQQAKEVAAEVFTRLNINEKEFGDVQSVLPLLKGKSFYELGLVWSNIEKLAKASPVNSGDDYGALEKLGMVIGRQGERLAGGYASGFSVAAENAMANIKEGAMVPAALANDPKKLIDHLTGGVAADMFSGGGASMADIFKPKEKMVALTKEQSDAVQKALTEKHEEHSLLYKLEQLKNQKVDPVTGSGLFGYGKPIADFGWQLTDAGVGMLSYTVPGGFAMNMLSYVEDSSEKFREAGIDYSTSGAMGLVSGAVQGLGDLLQLRSMPGLKSLGQAFAGPASAKAALKEYVAAGLFEAGVEVVQNQYADAGTQALFAAFRRDIPSVDWEQVNHEAWKSLPELVPVMLGLTAIGSGGAAIKNRMQAKELASNPVLLRHAGFSPELVTSISESKNPVAALQENWNQRAPLLAPAASPVEDLGQVVNEAYVGSNEEYRTLIQSEVAKLEEQKANFEREGITYARVDGGYEVRDSAAAPGSGVVFATPSEARAHAETLTNASMLHRDQVFQEALSTMLATMPAGREITILKADGNLLDQLITATDEGKTGDVASIWARAQQQRAKEGGAPLTEDVADATSAEFMGGLTVLGRSETQFKERVARSVSTLYLRGNIIDLVEENAENDLREMVGNAASKPQRLAAIAASIRRVEAATGDKYLHGEENETSITEAWSALVRIYTTGTRKGGNAITTGNRTEIAREVRESRRALQAAEKSNAEPGIFQRLRDHLTMLKTTLGQVARLMKAKQEGKLADVEDFIRKSIGLDMDHANAEAVASEAVGMVQAAEAAAGVAGVVVNGNGSVEYDARAGFSVGRVTPAQDAEYLAAVEDGDMEAAQRLVDAAAKAAGYDSAKVMHGTSARFDTFDKKKRGDLTESASAKIAFFFTDGRNTAQSYAEKSATMAEDKEVKALLQRAEMAERRANWDLYEKLILEVEEIEFGAGAAERKQSLIKDNSFIYEVYLKGDFLKLDAAGHGIISLKNAPDFKRLNGSLVSAINKARRLGMSGVEIANFDDSMGVGEVATHWAVFDSNQIKSADPVTRDESGNVIPLSQRFNPASNSISYSLSPNPSLLMPLIQGSGMNSETEVSREGSFRTFMTDYATASGRLYRFVKVDSEDKIISALGVKMKGPRSKSGVIVAAYTDEAHRRKGHASSVLRYAQKGFEVKHSTDLTNDGRAFKKADGVSYSLAPTARLQALEANLRARLAGAPEARLNILRDAQNKLQQLEYNYSTLRYTALGDEIKPVSERRTKESLDREQRQRRADRELELTEPIEFRYEEALNDTERANLYAHPLIDWLLGKPKPGSNFRQGRMMPYNYAIKHGYTDRVNGEYDNRDGVPNMFFKGRQKVDDVAKEAYEAYPEFMRDDSPEALFDAIKLSVAHVSSNRAELRKAQDELKAAKAQAKQEAAEWRAERDAEQKRDHEPKAAMLRDLRTMEAILMTVPAEVRGKVGGMLALATAGSDTSRFIEMQNRIRILGEELERYFKKELTEQTTELLRRGQPEREPGKQMRGHLGVEGHRAFKEMLKVYQMNPQELIAHQKGLDAQQAEADPTDEALLVALFEQMQIADYFGGWKKKSAVDMDAALKFAQDIWQEGRNKWGAVEMARLQEMKKLAAAVVEANGGVSYAKITGTDHKQGKRFAPLKNIGIELKNFPQFLEVLLGENHPVAKRWTDAVRAGFSRKEATIAETNRRFRDAVKSASGKTGLQAIRWAWDLAKDQSMTITTAGKLTTTTEDVPIEIYQRMRSGEVEFTQLGYTKEDVALLTQAYQDRLEEIARLRDIGEDFTANGLSARESIPLERSSRGEAEHVPMTPAQAVFLSMIHGQEQYRDALDKAGWDAVSFQEIEDTLPRGTKVLREFLAQEYKEGYGPMAEVFRRMFGVDLPSIRNYAPASFYHTGVDNTPGPDGNAANPEGGFRAGFLANRKQHTAPPKIENALAVWNGHVAQGAHWKNLAEVAREMKSVFSRPEVKQAIEGQHGKEMMNAANLWVKAIEGNGISESTGAIDKIVRALMGVQANVMLAFNVGTVLKQSSAMMGSAYKIPMLDYLKGWSKFLTGQLGYKAMLKSPLIQARLENGFSPEVRAIKSTLWDTPPTFWTNLRHYGLEIIGIADARFTAVSAAIAYDYHFNLAKENGLAQEQAAAQALAETERIVSQTAQPAVVPDKTLFENRANTFGKLAVFFMSEAMQKSGLYFRSVGHILKGSGSKADVRVLVIAHLMALSTQFITSLIRDLRNSDDDEWLDPEHWKPMDFVKAAVFGPLSGVPILGQALSGYSDDGLLGRYKAAKRSLEQFWSDEPMSMQDKVNAAATLGKGTTATIGVVSSLVQQAFGLIHNLVDDTENEGRKQLLKEAKAKAEARTEGSTEAELEAQAEEKKRKAREKTAAARAAAAARRAAE